MNNKLTGLLTTAIITGLMAGSVASAEDKTTEGSDKSKVSADKNACKGHSTMDKNGCKGESMKKKKADKNSCKNGCGESKTNTDKAGE